MDSGTLFGCFLGMVEAPMLKCTCNPSAAAGGKDKVCCAPFQTTLLVKNVRFEKRPKNNKKIRLATLPTLAAQAHRPAPNLVRSKGSLRILQVRVYNQFGTDTCVA